MKNQDTRLLEDVWTRFLVDEPIAPEERTALSLAVRTDNVFHRRLLHDLHLDGALRAAARSETEGEAFVSKVLTVAARAHKRQPETGPAIDEQARGHIVWRRHKAFTLALAATACAAGLLFVTRGGPRSTIEPPNDRVAVVSPAATPTPSSASRPRGAVAPARAPSARIEEVEGIVTIYDRHGRVRPAVVSESITPEEWLTTTGPNARVVVAVNDRIEVELTANAVVTGLGVRPHSRVFLARGDLRVSAAKGLAAPSLEVASPHAIAIGDACFRLYVSATETWVEVKRLFATLAPLRGGQPIKVPAEHVAIARANEVLTPIPIARAAPWPEDQTEP
jgi:hypothetical protein